MADDTAQIAFDSAIREFKLKLNDPRVYAEILQTTSIDQVYDATDKIQEEQSKKGHLRDLARIAPFLARLNDYAASIEVFVQIKPEILALIWGPIKLLLQWASAVKTSYDAIISTTGEIGILLPEFKKSAQMFHENKQIGHVLALYFKDIMEFYAIALKFSSNPHMFEALWPKQREKIKVVMDNIQNHTRLMRNEVHFEHIQREHEARLHQLEESESRKKAQTRQDYEYIKTDLAPKFFHEAFYRLSGQVCQGTGKWLLEDEKFVRWLKTPDKTVRVLWLQGIPGAGKTFLSATVISQAMKSGLVAFAFLTYTSSGSTTALSIIHSLIFQIVSQDENRQAVLLEAARDSLKIDISSATNILTTILSCAGPSYIIVDGLDEIEELERGRLLAQLLETSKACEDVSIFVSSRPESDINTKLSQEATVIRVDHKNYESIQAYVEQWTQQWFAEREFLYDDQIEIKARLAPLASKSQGMFLYAKLVLSSVEFMEDFSDIHHELDVLPESLDAAYGKILERINGSQNPVRRDTARKIIGWVACTPTPLTVQELQRALTIKEGVRDVNVRVRGNLPLVRLCGPIVEIADDYVQFVHFTAKEYMTSPRISGSVAIPEATLSLAACCMTYLCQKHHDLGVTDKEICSNLLNGLYVLHNFASTMWLKLVESCLDECGVKATSGRLMKALETLREVRGNVNYSGEISGNSSLLVAVSGVSLPLDLKAFLCQADQFRRISAASEHRVDQSTKNQWAQRMELLHQSFYIKANAAIGTSWIDLDPTSHSRLTAKIDHAVESLVSAKEAERLEYMKCLKHWYGTRPFKCRFVHCSSRREGFRETSDRKSHERHHDRPWKCSFPGCTYSEGGFLSRKMRDNHLDTFHRNQEPKNIIPLPTDASELLALLFDLVKSDQVDTVKNLLSLSECQSHRVVSEESRIELCKIAGYSGSAAMIDALVIAFFNWDADFFETDSNRSYYVHMFTKCAESKWRLEALESSIQAKNVDTFRFLLSKYRQPYVLCFQFFCAVVQSDTRELYDIWESRVIRAAGLETIDLPNSVLADIYLTRREFIQATASMPNREQLLLNHWKRVNMSKLEDKYLGDALVNVASTTQSISLAQYLLEIGAPIDHRRSSAYLTPLHCAAKVDSEQTAEFLKFLLYKGANPETDSKKTHIRDEPGVKGISRWLKVTWDELIAQVKKEMAAASQ